VNVFPRPTALSLTIRIGVVSGSSDCARASGAIAADPVTGAGTDSSEKGSQMWARVKGKTENDLAKLPFKQEFNFRPGLMKAAKGAKNVPSIYKYLSWLYPVLHALFPSKSCDLAQVGQAMINVTLHGYPTRILEVRDILEAAKRAG